LGRSSGGTACTTGGSLFGSREVIARNGGLMRREQAAGDNIDADHEEKRTEYGARDLIGLDIHRLGSPRLELGETSATKRIRGHAPATGALLSRRDGVLTMGF
jgi:hypothetical protein